MEKMLTVDWLKPPEPVNGVQHQTPSESIDDFVPPLPVQLRQVRSGISFTSCRDIRKGRGQGKAKVSANGKDTQEKATAEDGLPDLSELEIASHMALPADVFEVIAEHLTAQNTFGTCACLNVTNKAIRFQTKPALWKTVFVKSDRNASRVKPDPNVTKTLKAGGRHIQHVVDTGMDIGMSDGFRRLDQYRTFAPELRSVVATLEGGVPGMSLISLTAALSRDFLYDATDSYDLSRTLSLLFSDDGDLKPMRQSSVDLVFRVERLPTSTAGLPNDFQRFAGTLRYPSFRRILVHQLPTIAPQTEEHVAFFKFLKAFWEEDRLVPQAVHTAKRLELKVFKDYMAQTEKILRAWQESMLHDPFFVHVPLFVGVTSDILSGRTEEATARTVRELFAPFLESPDIPAAWSTRQAFAGINIRCPPRKDGRRMAAFLNPTAGSSSVTVEVGYWEFQGASRSEKIISSYHLAYGSSTFGPDLERR